MCRKNTRKVTCTGRLTLSLCAALRLIRKIKLIPNYIKLNQINPDQFKCKTIVFNPRTSKNFNESSPQKKKQKVRYFHEIRFNTSQYFLKLESQRELLNFWKDMEGGGGGRDKPTYGLVNCFHTQVLVVLLSRQLAVRKSWHVGVQVIHFLLQLWRAQVWIR